MDVNNLPRVVVRSRAVAGDRTRDLLIVSPTPYPRATAGASGSRLKDILSAGGAGGECQFVSICD